jgi:hypothetical protein
LERQITVYKITGKSLWLSRNKKGKQLLALAVAYCSNRKLFSSMTLISSQQQKGEKAEAVVWKESGGFSFAISPR